MTDRTFQRIDASLDILFHQAIYAWVAHLAMYLLRSLSP